MEISTKIEIVDLCLLINKRILIIPDIHLGYEESMQKKGIFLPRIQLKKTIKRLQLILNKTKPKKIIFIGDLKHEFGTLSFEEKSDCFEILDLTLEYTKDIILIQGNHDKIIKPIAKRKNLKLTKSVKINNILICHGDEIIKSNCKKIIIGHEHPAITLKENNKIEKFKCFLKGNYKKKELIVMPSFNLLTTGTDILTEKTLSPYLNQNLDSFQVFVIENKVYNFGTIKNIKESMI